MKALPGRLGLALVAALLALLTASPSEASGPTDLLRTVFAEANKILKNPATDDRPHERLSDREYQVLQMIGHGRTVSEIAGALSLSPKTVSTYRARVLEKMGMRTNAELTHYAIRHGITD